MGGEALALVLSAAVLHAVWNLAAKGVTEDRLLFIWLYVGLSAAIWMPIAIAWLIATDERLSWVWLGAAAVSAAIHTVYQVVLQWGYAKGDLNVVYPVARGTGPLLTFAVAVMVLGERPAVLGSVGVLLIVIGVLLISYTPRTQRGRATGGVLWGVATGLSIAAYTLWDSHSVTDLDVSPVAYYVLSLVCQAPVLTLMARPKARDLRRTWPLLAKPALTVALLSPLAYVLVLLAMQQASVALVAAARESSIVVGALIGWLVLKEARPLPRLAGAAVVAAGIGFILLG